MLFPTMVRSTHLQTSEDLQQHGSSSMSPPHRTTHKLMGWPKVQSKMQDNNEESSSVKIRSISWFIGSPQHSGHRTKTLLPFSEPLLKTEQTVSDLLKKDRVKQAKHFDQHTKQLSELKSGDIVRMKLPGETVVTSSCFF